MKKKFTAEKHCNSKKATKITTGITLAAGMVMMRTTIAFASATPVPTGTGITEVDNGIGKLIGFFTALVSAYGIIQLIKSGLDFFEALKDRDSGTMKQAGLGMLAGFGTACIGGVVSYLGFTW